MTSKLVPIIYSDPNVNYDTYFITRLIETARDAGYELQVSDARLLLNNPDFSRYSKDLLEEILYFCNKHPL